MGPSELGGGALCPCGLASLTVFSTLAWHSPDLPSQPPAVLQRVLASLRHIPEKPRSANRPATKGKWEISVSHPVMTWLEARICCGFLTTDQQDVLHFPAAFFPVRYLNHLFIWKSLAKCIENTVKKMFYNFPRGFLKQKLCFSMTSS